MIHLEPAEPYTRVNFWAWVERDDGTLGNEHPGGNEFEAIARAVRAERMKRENNLEIQTANRE